MTSTSLEISENDVLAFERQGAVCLRGLFDADWIARLRAAVERRVQAVAANPSKRAAHFSFTELFMWREDPEFSAFVFESPAAAIAARMMRAKSVRFYFDQLFLKEPGMMEPSPWHNDLPFWPIQGAKVCSVWLALDVVTKATSGLEYVAGSQRWEKIMGDAPPDFDAERDRYEMLNWDMQPGDCLVHHGLTVHGAGGNTSLDTRRRALATRWIGEDVVYREKDRGHAQLLVDGLKTGEALPPDRFPEVAVR
ncbi:MAG: phytanoyl-CoA dioxygenase family protein [Hyphomonadaceae bacterium]|nr:phytanoyl-CoA dioxygenase family protein [Hyphomonadaceae bacterium]